MDRAFRSRIRSTTHSVGAPLLRARESVADAIHRWFEPLGHLVVLGVPLGLATMLPGGTGTARPISLTGLAVMATALVMWLVGAVLGWRRPLTDETLPSTHLSAALVAGVGGAGVAIDQMARLLLPSGAASLADRGAATAAFVLGLGLIHRLAADVIRPHLVNPGPAVLMRSPVDGVVEYRLRLVATGSTTASVGIVLNLLLHGTVDLSHDHEPRAGFAVVLLLGFPAVAVMQTWRLERLRPGTTACRLSAVGALAAITCVLVVMVGRVVDGTAGWADIGLLVALTAGLSPLVRLADPRPNHSTRLATPDLYRRRSVTSACIACFLLTRMAHLAATGSPYLVPMTVTAAGVVLLSLGMRGQRLRTVGAGRMTSLAHQP